MKKLSGFLLCLLLACSPLALGASSSWNFGGAIGGLQGSEFTDASSHWTITGGTPSSLSVEERREADSLHVRGWVLVSSPSSTSLSLVMDHHTIDFGKLEAKKTPLGSGWGSSNNSSVNYYSSGNAFAAFSDGSTTNAIYFANSTGAGDHLFAAIAGSSGPAAPFGFHFDFTVPIANWPAGGGGAGGAKYCSGYITNSGTPAVSRSTENCAASVTDNGGGDTTVNFASSYFTAAPNCTVSPYGSSQILMYISSTTAPSASGVRFISVDSGSHSAADSDFFFNCVN